MKSYLFKIVIFLIWFLPSCVSSNHCVDSNNFYCVRYINNYDGDTITVDIKGVHPVIGQKMKVRIAGIDTPEIKSQTTCEQQKAQSAKKMTAYLLTNAKTISLKNIKRGKYFRIVSDVMADNISVGQYLIKKGLAYSYTGQKKQKVNWCGKQPTLTPENKK